MKRKALFAVILAAVSMTALLSGCAPGEIGSPVSGFYTSLEELSDAKIGVYTGTVGDSVLDEVLPDCHKEYMNSFTDLAVALNNGKVDAYIMDEPIARLTIAQYPDQQMLVNLRDDNYGYIFAKNDSKGDKLLAQMNEFLAEIKADGTLDVIDSVWFGSDESRQEVDYSGLSAENGIVQLAVATDIGEPFVYIKDDSFVGYDVDIAVRFCREYGYGIKIVDSNFAGMLSAVASGKCDFGGSCISITDERRESFNFSEPNYRGGQVIVVKEQAERAETGETIGALKIGILTGSVAEDEAKQYIPNCQIKYIATVQDMANELEMGRIDAYICDQPVVRMLLRQYHNQEIFATLQQCPYGFIFPKNDEKYDRLREQMNEFLAKIKADGTLAQIDDLWFGTDEALQTVDYSGLSAENGVLTLAVSSTVGEPFTYIKDGKYVGYDIDIAVRFCREYGYGLDISDSSFAGLIAAVMSGKCDFGVSCITFTEGRAEFLDFSDPDYEGGDVIVTIKGRAGGPVATVFRSTEALNGKRIGVVSGSMHDQIVKEHLPDCTIVYINTNTDLALALASGKIDAYVIDLPAARQMLRVNKDQMLYTMLTEEEYGFVFRKDNEQGAKLCAQMNEFLAKLRADGTMSQINDIWFGDDESLWYVDYDELSAENGILHFVMSSDVGAPFAYVYNGRYAGYEVDIAARFCREYGYGIEIENTNIAGLRGAVISGESDFAAFTACITEERKQSMLFHDADYVGGVVVITPAEADANAGFWQGIKESFIKTFIREDRWKLFADGIGITVLITALSAIFGTLLGFAVFMLYRKDYLVPNAVINGIMNIFEKTPVVVILMIMYYIIFGKLTLDAVWVSVLGFSLIFGAAVISLLKVGVGAVDKGQTEASLALGYTDMQTFFRTVLPQAAKHFLPGYRGELVSLIKGTAIVGYIAVQDLTKVSDIVRSRTYEAFFPLIVSAVIYFVIAWLLTMLVKRIEFGVDPKRRNQERILEGVKTK